MEPPTITADWACVSYVSRVTVTVDRVCDARIVARDICHTPWIEQEHGVQPRHDFLSEFSSCKKTSHKIPAGPSTHDSTDALAFHPHTSGSGLVVSTPPPTSRTSYKQTQPRWAVGGQDCASRHLGRLEYARGTLPSSLRRANRSDSQAY
jgi:hypothetical protein